MMKFNFTKQFITAALVASVSFFGCQKSEMEEVDTLMAMNNQELSGMCGDILDNLSIKHNLGNKNNPNIQTTGTLEIGNDAEHIFVEANTHHVGVESISFKYSLDGGGTFTDKSVSADAEAMTYYLQATVPYNLPSGTEILFKDIKVNIKLSQGATGAGTTEIFEEDITEISSISYLIKACEVLDCSYDKDYWKQNEDKWKINGLTLPGNRGNYTKGELLDLLSTGNANDSFVKLTQAYTVAKLNAANNANLNETLANGSTLGTAIKEADDFFGNPNHTSKTKLPAGIIGRLHQLPSCK